MKVVIITTILLIVFFLGALYFTQYVNINSDRLLITIQRLDKAVLEEDWKSAREELNNFKEDWKEVSRVFEYLLEHYDIDDINVALAKIEKFIAVEDRNLTLGEITKLNFVINLIKKRETFSLANLF